MAHLGAACPAAPAVARPGEAEAGVLSSRGSRASSPRPARLSSQVKTGPREGGLIHCKGSAPLPLQQAGVFGGRAGVAAVQTLNGYHAPGSRPRERKVPSRETQPESFAIQQQQAHLSTGAPSWKQED